MRIATREGASKGSEEERTVNFDLINGERRKRNNKKRGGERQGWEGRQGKNDMKKSRVR